MTRSLMNILYTKFERYLLKNNRCFVVSTQQGAINSSYESESASNFEEIEKIKSPYFRDFLNAAVQKR